MLNKEIRSVSRIILFWFSFFILALAVNAVDLWAQSSWGAWSERFFISLQVFLLLFPLFLGLSLFMEESRQKGMEYLLTLPYSRGRILWVKMAPRLAALAGMSIIYSGIYIADTGSFLSYNWFPFTLAYAVLFLLGISISIGLESSLVSIAAAFLSSLVYFTLVATACIGALLVFRLRGDHRLAYSPFDSMREYIGNLLGGSDFFPDWILPTVLLIFLLPFLLAFFHSARRLDLRSARIGKAYLKRFFLVLAAVLPLATVLIVFSFKSRIQSLYYLTAGLQVVECRRNTLTVHSRERIRKFKLKEVGYVVPVTDQEGWIYMIGSVKKSEVSLWRLQLQSGRIENLYRSSADQENVHIWNILFAQDFISFIKARSGDGTFFPDYSLGAIALPGKEFQEFPLNRGKETKGRYNRLIASDVVEGKRFWLISSWSKEGNIIRVWDNGKQEVLDDLCVPVVYRRPVLASFRNDRVEFFDMSTGIPRRTGDLIGTYSFVHRFLFQPGGMFSRQILVRSADKSRIFCLDLDDSSIKFVNKIDETASIYELRSDRYYFIFDRKKRMDLIRLDGCRLQTLKRFEWESSENFYRNFFDSPHGLVVKEKGRVRAYAYPDLQEIKFK